MPEGPELEGQAGRLEFTSMVCIEMRMTVAYRGGQVQVIWPNDGSQEWLQSRGATAEKRLVVALILTVLLRRLWREHRV